MSVSENLWSFLFYNLHPFTLECILPYCTTVVTFSTFAVFFLYLDFNGHPKKLRRFRLNQNFNGPVSRDLLLKTLKLAAINVFLVGPLMEIIFYSIRHYINNPLTPNLPKSFHSFELFVRYVIALLIGENAIYYTHRALHLPYFFRIIHKTNHEWSSPSSIVFLYRHPIEYAMWNCFAISLGPLLLRFHPLERVFWNFGSMIIAVFHYSGYEFPLAPSSEFVSYHYKKNNCNFGPFSIADFFNGTDAVQIRRVTNK